MNANKQTMEDLIRRIKALLVRGGPGAARQEADEEIIQKAAQGMQRSAEIKDVNEADFAREHENWYGLPPRPTTPREDPEHVGRSRKGWLAVWFILSLKVVFWVVFGPTYFNVLAWVAVLIALAVSIPLSLGIKPLIASLILKPGLTPRQREGRLHLHLVSGTVAFAVSFGGLFLLRGIAGPLALVGALLVLPLLSLCDLVLLYLMGVAEAYVQLYSWARPFLKMHDEFLRYFGEFVHYRDAAQRRLPPPVEVNSAVSVPTKPPEQHLRTIAKSTASVLAITILFAFATARAQGGSAELEFDSTSSIYPGVAERLGPELAHWFYTWAERTGVSLVRVSTFERDGWMPRQVGQDIPIGRTLAACKAQKSEGGVFRGIAEELERNAREACERAKDQEASSARATLTSLVATAWRPPQLAVINGKKEPSCTAIYDALSALARRPPGNLIVLVSDAEETCNRTAPLLPKRSAGAQLVVVLVPSKYDMGPGVSAARRFEAKKTQLFKMAPWITAILAPVDLENFNPSLVSPRIVITASVELDRRSK